MINKRRQSRKNITLPITKAPLLTLMVFVIGFGSGYLFYEDQLPAVFSSETEAPKINVCFSPEGQCEKLALFAINQAQKEILVQSYSFTSKPISNALIEASRRGVSVRVLFDRSQLKAPYS
ncbi:MAG TPA: hypothetical protein DD412_06705 [Holosporales bacterium]|nr:hypothetical protein [Holosporales bacterium]